MDKKMKALVSILTFAIIFAFSQAQPLATHPQPLHSFNLNQTQQQTVGSCSYTANIKTSCTSPRRTRDQISLSFGDKYGNQVYAPRLDDPSSRTFERCSMDTFKISGPCTYQTCYLYLYRNGNDGWKPEKVTVYGTYSKAITFYYNTFIPNGVWCGFNLCKSSSLSSTATA